jgi:hypothetical protein
VKSPAILLLALAFALPSLAQKADFTDYDDDAYHAAFINKPVVTPPQSNADNTTSTYSVGAKADEIMQIVSVRTLFRDIPVNQASADFYTQPHEGEKVIETTTDTLPGFDGKGLNGHQYYSYAKTKQADGCLRWEFVIIVNSRKVVMITQYLLNKDTDDLVAVIPRTVLVGQFKLKI